MKKENDEVIDAYRIRIDALEIVNSAYLAKIEALEMLNRNLQFLLDVRNQAAPARSSSPGAPSIPGVKRGRGRPRKYPIGTQATAAPSGEKRGRGRPRKYPVTEKPVVTGEKRGRGRPRKNPEMKAVSSAAVTGEKRGRGRSRKTTGGAVATSVALAQKKVRSRGNFVTRLQLPLETWLRENLAEEGFNKATFRALTGILLCLFDNGTATVSSLNEYIGGSRVTVVRHTAFLKKMKLLTYEGSRKKGYYQLTAQGRALKERLENA